MSLRVLLVLEDASLNGYLLEPVVEALLADVGKPFARIHKLSTPEQPQGFDHAVKLLKDVRTQTRNYPERPIWVFLPDADRGTPDVLDRLEAEVRLRGPRLLTCALQPEAEIIGLVGRETAVNHTWAQLRAHPRLKEAVFDPYLRSLNSRAAGRGRAQLAQSAISNLQRLYRRCGELKVLRDRLAAEINQIEGTAP